jgi:hypothetical protein
VSKKEEGDMSKREKVKAPAKKKPESKKRKGELADDRIDGVAGGALDAWITVKGAKQG